MFAIFPARPTFAADLHAINRKSLSLDKETMFDCSLPNVGDRNSFCKKTLHVSSINRIVCANILDVNHSTQGASLQGMGMGGCPGNQMVAYWPVAGVIPSERVPVAPWGRVGGRKRRICFAFWHSRVMPITSGIRRWMLKAAPQSIDRLS